MFGIDKVDIRKLLRQIEEGDWQLPDFQRDYVWSDVDSRRLIASVVNDFPVGALLTLETGGLVNFKSRPIEGASAKSKFVSRLLLDGQQRMTSLFMAIYTDKPVRTKSGGNKERKRYYFIDIELALSSDNGFEDFIIGVPETKQLRKYKGNVGKIDLSREEEQFKNHLFPLNRIFNFSSWYSGYVTYWKSHGENWDDRISSFEENVVNIVASYEMPIITLDKNISREAICLVFEKVNVGGKKLDAFELLTAIYAAQDFRLRENWYGKDGKANTGICTKIMGASNLDVMSRVKPIEFLQTCTLIHTCSLREAQVRKGVEDKLLQKIGCSRSTILELSCEDYKKSEKRALDGFLETGRFLSDRGILLHANMPYPVLIVGLSAAFALLKKNGRSASAKEKIAQWFWISALSEVLVSGSDSRLARDIPDLVGWVKSNSNKPSTVVQGQFYEGKFDELKDRTKDTFKAVYALLLQHECRDFVKGDKVSTMTHAADAVEVHHIFPKKWCEERGIEASVYDTIVNKTPLSAATNREIAGDAPSVYLKKIETEYEIDSSKLDEFLKSHLIDPVHLRNDDFDKFLIARKESFCQIVGTAMKKVVLKNSAADDS